MTGLVFELQRDALNSEIKVSELLRKALVVSKKLNITEMEEWINKELNGYSDKDNIPEYRIVTGDVKFYNPVHGCWLPIFFEDTKEAEKLSKRLINQSVDVLDSLAKNNTKIMHIPFQKNIENYLIRKMDALIPFQISLLIDKNEVIGILNTVKNKILDWSLKLEQKGILGEGMSFSEKEKHLAQTVNYHITNNIGNMQNSQLLQDSAGATQSLNVTNNSANLKELVAELEKLKREINNFGLQLIQKQELEKHISILNVQSRSTKPNDILIQESKRTIRNIIEGAIGSTASSGLVYYLSLFQ